MGGVFESPDNSGYDDALAAQQEATRKAEEEAAAAEAAAKKREEAQRERRRAGRLGTILTSGQGDTSEVKTKKSTLGG